MTTYLTTAKIGPAFLVIRLDPATLSDLNAPINVVSGPHKSRRAANTSARAVCATTGEDLTNEAGSRI